MRIYECPHEILTMVFFHAAVEDLPARMKVCITWNYIIEATQFNKPGRHRLREAKTLLRKSLSKQSGHALIADIAKAKVMLKFKDIDLSKWPLVSWPLRRECLRLHVSFWREKTLQ